MSHDIHQMAYVGKEPWHGLGTQLPTSSTYEEVVQAAGFYTAVERSLYAPPMEEPIPDRKGLFRGDTSEYLATVHKDYEVVQFEFGGQRDKRSSATGTHLRQSGAHSTGDPAQRKQKIETKPRRENFCQGGITASPGKSGFGAGPPERIYFPWLSVR